MNKLVYMTYPVLILILLAGSKFYKKNEWNDEFLSLQQSKHIQGFLAICIMLHHIGQETCAAWQNYPLFPGLEVFVPVGYWFVGFFLLCSGYGLFKSYKTKNDYLKGFFKKRILPLIIAFYVTAWIFLVARFLMHQKMSRWMIFCFISGLKLCNPNAWFVIAMPVFYLFFYFSFKIFKTERMKICGVIIGIFLYTLLGTCLNHPKYWMMGEWWYNCVHLFWIGLLLAKYETKFTELLKKKYVLFLILSITGTFVFYITSEIAQGMFSYYGEYNPNLSQLKVIANRWICLITQMIACLLFSLSILVVNLKLKIGNRILSFMGSITLEFYLIHGLFIELFAYRFCDVVPSIVRITNVALLILVVTVLGIFSSIILKKLDTLIFKLLCHNNKNISN